MLKKKDTTNCNENATRARKGEIYKNAIRKEKPLGEIIAAPSLKFEGSPKRRITPKQGLPAEAPMWRILYRPSAAPNRACHSVKKRRIILCAESEMKESLANEEKCQRFSNRQPITKGRI